MLFVLLVLYGVVFALLRDLLGSIVPLIVFHAAMGFVRLLQRELRECSVDVRHMDDYDRRGRLVCQEKRFAARKGRGGLNDRLGLARFFTWNEKWKWRIQSRLTIYLVQ